MLSGSTSVKTLSKMLVKLTPGRFVGLSGVWPNRQHGPQLLETRQKTMPES